MTGSSRQMRHRFVNRAPAASCDPCLSCLDEHARRATLLVHTVLVRTVTGSHRRVLNRRPRILCL